MSDFSPRQPRPMNVARPLDHDTIPAADRHEAADAAFVASLKPARIPARAA